MITLAIVLITVGCLLFVLGCLGLIAQAIVPVLAGIVVLVCVSYLFRLIRNEDRREPK